MATMNTRLTRASRFSTKTLASSASRRHRSTPLLGSAGSGADGTDGTDGAEATTGLPATGPAVSAGPGAPGSATGPGSDIADPRVERRVGEVCEEVADHHEAGHEQEDPEEERVCAALLRVPEEQRHARIGEEHLHEQRAAHQCRHAEPDGRDEGQQRV